MPYMLSIGILKILRHSEKGEIKPKLFQTVHLHPRAFTRSLRTHNIEILDGGVIKSNNNKSR